MASPPDLDDVRSAAFGAAYRMLGSVTEAEDVAQEALLRLHAEPQPPASAQAWVTTVATRLAIDQLRSARVRRETYVGEWLPEPIVTGGPDDPVRHAEIADSLSTAFLLLLERLSPEERAAFLLREVFGYPYAEIAEVLERSQDATRQLVSRARRHIDAGRRRFEPDRQRREALVEQFFTAIESGDTAGLIALLAADVELHGDGGGKVPALARPVSGRERVARTLFAWAKVGARAGISIRRAEINGQPGAISFAPDGGIVNAFSLDVAGGAIVAVHSIVNPDKLGHLGRPAMTWLGH
jgi:RNA polymerase sigma-70 factor (TIGR02957 family)